MGRVMMKIYVGEAVDGIFSSDLKGAYRSLNKARNEAAGLGYNNGEIDEHVYRAFVMGCLDRAEKDLNRADSVRTEEEISRLKRLVNHARGNSRDPGLIRDRLKKLERVV